MKFPDDVSDDVRLRLRRLEGQIRGLQRMLDEGQDCESIVTQLAAAKAALDRVGYRLVAAGMRHCARLEPDAPADDETGLDVEDLEKLFLKLS
ncbi:metal-sensitive transcriptional regulator [Actinomarinicola tropica]|uniref:metal-sensitive transcriptional regulator n=1 Tax=Actinomarinicola tropica TaxID=2789776 RepID=UPI001E493C3E|nr:metal-sensitive transcriptional regulator [Actinomarinicola tropica]